MWVFISIWTLQPLSGLFNTLFWEAYLQTAGKTDSCSVTCFPCTVTHALIINWLTAYISGYNTNLHLQLLVCHSLLFSTWPQCELLKWIWVNEQIPLAGGRNAGTEQEGSVFPAEGVIVKHILKQVSTCWRKISVLQLNGMHSLGRRSGGAELGGGSRKNLIRIQMEERFFPCLPLYHACTSPCSFLCYSGVEEVKVNQQLLANHGSSTWSLDISP